MGIISALARQHFLCQCLGPGKLLNTDSLKWMRKNTYVTLKMHPNAIQILMLTTRDSIKELVPNNSLETHHK